MTENTTTAAPAATQPEALRLALDVLREMLSNPDQRLDQCPARMTRANQAARALAGVQAAPAAQEAEPATGLWQITENSGTHGWRSGWYVFRESPSGREWLKDEKRRIAHFASRRLAERAVARTAAPQAPAAAIPEQEEVDFLVRVLDTLAEWSSEDWNELFERQPAIAGLVRPLLTSRCNRPPAGWNCSRTPGHDGPCAAAQAPAAAVAPAAAPTQEADGWMPIETAPRDGTEIDLFNRDGHREAGAFWGLPPHECGEMGRYCDSEWHGYEPGWVTDFWGEPQPDSHFTHWRRPPAPPAARARQEGAQHER